MATNTPNVNAPVWESAQATPWVTMASQARIFDAFAVAVIVEQMDVNSPPASCADGARYEIGPAPTGLWNGHAGELAIAVGVNATNGWEFADIAIQGAQLYDRSTGINYQYLSGNWTVGSGSSSIQGATDFSGSLIDGYVLRWDASNTVFYLSPDAGRAPATIRQVTGTTVTLAPADIDNIIECTSGSAITLTCPDDSSIPIGAAFEVHVVGAGTLTVVGASGPPAVTIQSRGGVVASAGQYAMIFIRKVAARTYRITGDLA